MEKDDIKDLRVTKLREYLINVINDIKDEFNQLNIDFLSNEPENYSLDKMPVEKKVEQWIIGPTIERDVYSFKSRLNYSADVMLNLANAGFYEVFENKIKYNDDRNILPEIKGIQSISCLNAGTMVSASTNTAEFDIQIEIQYIEPMKMASL